jgi:hypothetical protein
MELYTRAVLVAAGLVHLLPAAGLLGARALERLYGVAIDDADLLLMLRHRALLFGLLGAGLLAAVVVPALRTALLTAGLLSTAGFCLLALPFAELSPALRRVALIDLPLVPALALALYAQLRATMPH